MAVCDHRKVITTDDGTISMCYDCGAKVELSEPRRVGRKGDVMEPKLEIDVKLREALVHMNESFRQLAAVATAFLAQLAWRIM